MRVVTAQSHLLLSCTGALQGPPMKLLWFKGAVGGRLFTAISHGRIGNVVKNESQPQAGERWCSRHSCPAASNSLQSCHRDANCKGLAETDNTHAKKKMVQRKRERKTKQNKLSEQQFLPSSTVQSALVFLVLADRSGT